MDQTALHSACGINLSDIEEGRSGVLQLRRPVKKPGLIEDSELDLIHEDLPVCLGPTWKARGRDKELAITTIAMRSDIQRSMILVMVRRDEAIEKLGHLSEKL
jgi:hypothetical protein